MKNNMRAIAIITLAAIIMPACSVRAGIGDTGTYSNETLTVSTAVSASSAYYVGDTGTNNVLTIQDGGSMTFDMSHWHGLVIGYGDGGNHNKVVIEQGGLLTAQDGGHDVWAVALGGRGSAAGGSQNELVVDGGTATNLNWIRIGDGGNVTGNVVRVLNNGLLEAGSGILLSTRTGAKQSGLEVASGGTARGADLRMGQGSDSGGSDWVHVHGGGTLELDSYVHIGQNEANHLVHVYDEGGLTADSVSIGYNAGVTNSVLRVDGSGSTVDITGEIQIGRESGADHNAMLVTTGAQASAGNVVITHGTGNRLEIIGDEAAMEVTDDVVLGDSTGAVDATLVVTNGGQLAVGGNLNLRLSDSNFAHVTENGEVTVGNHLYVGWLTAARGMKMRVDHGGQVSVDSDMRIGHNSSQSEMVIDGTGTRVSVDGETAIGYGSASGSNTLTISNGGRLDSTASVIGRNAATETRSSGNEALVTGTGSMWTNTGTLKVGGEGAYNSLFIENGGVVFSDTLVIGEEGHDNRLAIDGYGSTLDINGNLWIAEEWTSEGTDRNVMLVTTGAQVNVGGDALVAERGADNRLEIVGADAVMQVATNVYLGDHSSAVGAELLVADGGKLAAGNDLSLRQADGISAHVSGGGEVTVGNRLYVGWLTAARDISMLVDDGGQVTVDNDLYVGFNSSRSDLVIDGTGTRVGTDGETVIGYGSASGSNTLTITDGGRLESTASVIGRGYSPATGARASGNEVLVTGTGSMWTNSGLLEISRSEGVDNKLRVADEATVVAENLTVGVNGLLEVEDASVGADAWLTVEEDGHIALGGTGSLIQVGWGAWDVYNDYSANRVLVADYGNLTLDGSIDPGADGALIVETQGALHGSGTVQGDADVAGGLHPGSSAGTLTVTGELTLRDSSKVYIELGGIDPGDSDMILADKIVIEGGTLYFSFLGGYEPVDGHVIQIAMANELEGAFAFHDDSALPEGWSVNTDNLYMDGTVTVIPEPSSLILLLSAGALLLRRIRRA